MFQFGGLELCLGGLSPPKPHMATAMCCKTSASSLMQLTMKSRLLSLCDMSNMQGMSSFLYASMTGPKVAQRIQAVSTLLHEAKPVLGYFAFI